jgi:radical SAM protein with 4Fe4S-binding SPASM domain
MPDQEDPFTSLVRWKIGWGVTHRCNMHCPFCYSAKTRQRAPEMDFASLKAFVDANHASIASINYGTGENTLSETWFELVKYVRRAYPQVKQALTTNGTLAPALEKRPDAGLVLAALDEVDISLDFNDAARHSAFRGHPQAFDWAMDTIARCQAVSIKTTLVILGIDDTLQVDRLARIFDLAGRSGCFVRINIFRPNLDQQIVPLSYPALKSALAYLVREQVVVALSDPLVAALVLGREAADPSGKSSLRILPDGSITPSTYLVTEEWKRGHIRTARLQDIAFARGLSQALRTAEIPAACLSCSRQELCKGGTIDRRIIWYGTLAERDPYCPYRHAEPVAAWAAWGTIRTAPGPEIHDGYLPTLIFAPRT